MLLEPHLCRLRHRVDQGLKSRRQIERTAPLARDDTQAHGQAGKMVGAQSFLAHQFRNEQRAKPGGVLQHLDRLPGIEQYRGAQDGRKLLRFQPARPAIRTAARLRSSRDRRPAGRGSTGRGVRASTGVSPSSNRDVRSSTASISAKSSPAGSTLPASSTALSSG